MNALLSPGILALMQKSQNIVSLSLSSVQFAAKLDRLTTETVSVFYAVYFHTLWIELPSPLHFAFFFSGLCLAPVMYRNMDIVGP